MTLIAVCVCVSTRVQLDSAAVAVGRSVINVLIYMTKRE